MFKLLRYVVLQAAETMGRIQPRMNADASAAGHSQIGVLVYCHMAPVRRVVSEQCEILWPGAPWGRVGPRTSGFPGALLASGSFGLFRKL